MAPYLEIGAAVSGTNWHKPEVLRETVAPSARAAHFATARIADLVLYGDTWKTAVIGLVMPDRAGIALTDAEDTLPISQYWSYLSDHFPVGGLLSARPDDLRPWAIVAFNDEANRATRWLNHYRLAYLFALLSAEAVTAGRKELLALLYDSPPHNEWAIWLDYLRGLIQAKRKDGDQALKTYRHKRSPKGPRLWDDGAWPGKVPFEFASTNKFWDELRKRLGPFQDALVEAGILKEADRGSLEDLAPHDYGWEG
ncbi:MAG: hypothetical protein QM820_13455 [Minicystis sp.]